jgi:hypothetical protein
VCGCCVASAFIIVWLCFRRLFSIFVDYYWPKLSIICRFTSNRVSPLLFFRWKDPKDISHIIIMSLACWKGTIDIVSKFVCSILEWIFIWIIIVAPSSWSYRDFLSIEDATHRGCHTIILRYVRVH